MKEDINENSEAYQTGFEARLRGESETDNPYVPGTWEADNWCAGWQDAG